MASKSSKLESIVDNLSIDELRRLSNKDICAIVIKNNLDDVDVTEFIFSKNIKIFGGINGYVTDFFSYNTISKISNIKDEELKNNSKNGAIILLKKFLTYSEITRENRVRINYALLELNNN
jgi:hypothetical protein